MSLKKIIIVLLSLFCLILIMAAGLGYHYLSTPANKDASYEIFVVKKGTTFHEVVSTLDKRNIIVSGFLFKVWGRFMGYGRQIQAGEYRLSASMTPLQIIDMLTRGIVVSCSVTIPEGFTARQIGRFLGRQGIVDPDEFISLTLGPGLPGKYGLGSPNLEGYLYPDTYQFRHGSSSTEVIDTMVRRFFDVVGPMKKRVKEIGMTLEEVVTLASIIEKETAQPNERMLIASVFLNRLKKGIRLASDPTVIYALKNFNGNLTKKDLLTPTPYNTYIISGLPPGPISNPGLEAIRAVLYPASTDYLYFVSKNDGSHFFSRTYKEHQKAVQTYQKKRKKRMRPEQTAGGGMK